MLKQKSLLLTLSLSALVGCGGGGGSDTNETGSNGNGNGNGNTNSNVSVNAEILQPITALTRSQNYDVPAMNSLPSFSIKDESGFEGDIDDDLSLIAGTPSITVVDIQRDWGVSAICDEGINEPAYLNEADYSTQTITETAYTDGQTAFSCSSKFTQILPVVLTNSNISNVLEDWDSENLISTDCPTATNGGPQVTPPTSFCESITVRNFLITDNTGKQHKISYRTTTYANE